MTSTASRAWALPSATSNLLDVCVESVLLRLLPMEFIGFDMVGDAGKCASQSDQSDPVAPILLMSSEKSPTIKHSPLGTNTQQGMQCCTPCALHVQLSIIQSMAEPSDIARRSFTFDAGAHLSIKSPHPQRQGSWGNRGLGMHLRLPPPPLPRLTLLWSHPALQKMRSNLPAAAHRGSTSPPLHQLALHQMVTAAAEKSRSVLNSGLAAVTTLRVIRSNSTRDITLPNCLLLLQRSACRSFLQAKCMQTVKNEHAYPQEGYCEICRQQWLS